MTWASMWLASKSLTAKCKMSSLHFCPWKLVSLFCYLAVPPLQDREADEEAECCQVHVGENVYWFLLSYKGAQSTEEQLLFFAAFHIPHETKGPKSRKRNHTEWHILGVSDHRIVQVHCWDSKHPGPLRPPSASDQVISHSGLMFPHLYWRRKSLQSYLPLSGGAQRVKELMFIKCSASQRETMDKTQGVAMAHSRPHFQGS